MTVDVPSTQPISAKSGAVEKIPTSEKRAR